MKAPEMPGRIIAQMAIAPESRINHHVSGVSAGVATVIHHAAATPIRHAATVCTRQRPICLATSSAEATIRPKKNDQMAIGWFVSREVISRASEKIAMAMPSSTGSRNRPLICRQNSFSRSVPSSRRAVASTLLIDSISSS